MPSKKAPSKKRSAKKRADRSGIPRVKAVRDLIYKKNCTHALITDITDVEYISGFRASNAMLLISQMRLHLFTDFRYMEAAKEFCEASGKWKFNLVADGNYQRLKRKLREDPIVAIQSDDITVNKYFDLERMLPHAKFVPLPNELAEISVSKTLREISFIEEAAQISCKALEQLVPYMKSGVTEIELARTLENICNEFGSEKPAFDTIVLFGERSAMPHGVPSERQLAKGDFILIDFGCTVNGFRSDITRTFVFGKASREQREIYDTVLQAQESASLAARAGVTGKAIDAAARDIITDAGYGEYFGHGTGHGVGLRVHERPRLNKSARSKLPENCVVTIEPGIYLPDVGGVRIEDLVVLQDDGIKVLTTYSKELIEL